VKTLPGVREAIEQREWASVEREVGRLSLALERAAAHLSAVIAVLEAGG
jgi:N-acetylated-alpha-linked acidic dipeptidase